MSPHGQRSRRAASAARLAVLAGLLVLLLSPLLANPAPEPAAPVAPPSADQPAVAEPAPALPEARSAESAPEPTLSQPRPTRAPLAGRSPDGLALHVLRYVPLIVEISAEVGADPAVLAALMEVELSGEDAVSRAGALGLMQLMPDKLEPGDDPFDPPTNVRRAAQHVRRLATTWQGDLATVAGSYFGAVDAEGYVTEASDGIATGTEYVNRFAAAYRRWALALEMPVQPVVMRVRPPAGPVVLHTVRPGDSARGLAARYGISLATLAAANQLTDPDLLLVGQELRIPTVDGVLHTLQPGESLSQLAERYGVPASRLLAANRLAEEPAAGALLVVPGVDPTQPPAPAEAEPPEPTAPRRVDEAPPPEVSARSLAVLDEASGALLYGQDERTRVAPASLTKIATTLVALQREADLGRRVPVTISGSAMAARDGSSIMGLEPGRQVQLATLLYGMMLPSGNDAAEQVALALGGRRETYIGWMNEAVAELGLADTHFVNPSGMDAPGQYSSAYDMALLGRAAMRNETFRQLAGAPNYHDDGYNLPNLNRLIGAYPGADGLKVGRTRAAGRTIVASASRDGRRVYVSLMRSQDLVGDSTALFDWVWRSFAW